MITTVLTIIALVLLIADKVFNIISGNRKIDLLESKIKYGYDPTYANAEIDNRGKRIDKLNQDNEELSKERSKLIEKIEQLSKDSENNIKLLDELEHYKDNSIPLAKMPKTGIDNYLRIIYELKHKEYGIGAFLAEQVKIEKDIEELKKSKFCVFFTKTSKYAIIHRTDCRHVCRNKKGVKDSKGNWWYRGFDNLVDATDYLKGFNNEQKLNIKEYTCPCTADE